MIDRGELEKGAQICSRLHCRRQSECSQLGYYFFKKREKDIPGLILLKLVTWGPKELSELQIFNLSEDDAY